jgi:para-nitrobenzyl esterase
MMFSFLLVVSISLVYSQNTTQIKTTSGIVQGYIGNGIRNFLGIPYATAERFGLPQTHTWQGILSVMQYGKVCPQKGINSTTMSEDCLFLNIMTPLTITEPLPVMFWIHGGAFNSGAGSIYNGTNYVEKNIIVVTINYRLAALGYLQSLEIWNENPTSPTLGGMNGMLDQLFALTWVNQNIAAFGGDPARITIMGESAGGISVCLLAASPLSSGLFTNVFIQSGSCTGSWGPGISTLGLVEGQLYLESLDCFSIAEVRALPLSTLMASPYWSLNPAVDDHFLNALPSEIYAAGNSQIPSSGHIMLSSNTLDTLFGYPWYNGPFPQDNTELKTILTQYFGPDADSIYNIYPGTPSPQIAFQRINGHLCVTCPTLDLIDDLIADTYRSIYLYQFGFNPMNPHWAGHAADIPLVFGMPIAIWPFDSTLSGAMIDYLSNYIITGNPGSVGNNYWPVYLNGSQSMYFDMGETIQSGANRVECNFWKQYQQAPGNLLKMMEYCFQRPNLKSTT